MTCKIANSQKPADNSRRSGLASTVLLLY